MKALFVLILAGTALSGCGQPSILDASSPPEKKEREEIVLWHTYSELETEVLEQEVIPLFEDTYPEYDIIPVRQAYNEQLKYTLIARASAGKEPDVIRMDITWVTHFAERNLLYPVSEFQDFDETAASLLDRSLSSGLYGGQYFSLPLNTNTKAAIYNRDLLDQAGYKQPPDTMEKLIQLIEENNYSIGVPGLAGWELMPYFYALGGQLMDVNHSQATGFLNSEQSIQAVNTLRRLYQQGNLIVGQLGAGTDLWRNIREGKNVMIDEGPWFYSIQSTRLDQITGRTVSAPFPVTEGRGSVMGGENMVMSKKTAHPEGAWTFMKWMVSEEPQRMMLRTGLIPTNKNVDLDRFIAQFPYYKSYVEGLPDAFLRPTVSEWDAIDEVFKRTMTSLFLNEKETRAALTEAAQEIDQLLQEGMK